jgi:UDP-N-acetylglucosamine 2-epimerase (non-hydrolysing)/GDP/UDP-N,N'-diacetylbacillosamine 2-epimerase (hydrolysing)
MPSSATRTVCFVTGTRAEFGLMEGTLRAIRAQAGLRLQIVATGMHLDPRHGRTVDQIRRAGWRVDATVPWRPAKDDLAALARETGRATAGLADVFEKLGPDIVLVVGDRVEAFAAATAGHLSGRVVAHVHGGDRALGQVDDALRHAITKLAHVHFPATRESADRILKLGEDKWRVHLVGSPGIDGITSDAFSWTGHQAFTLAENRGRYALMLLHPTDPDDALEYRRAKMLIESCISAGFPEIIAVYPNNDPGSAGIVRAMTQTKYPPVSCYQNLVREAFLGLLRDAAVLVGNSSSGIIEAASFGTPVVDVGPRQAGRERGENVTTVPFRQADIRRALARIWNGGKPLRFPKKNPYGRGDTARRVARVLANVELSPRLRRKLIAY